MPQYTITVDDRLGRVPDRDATAITVRIHCDDNDLGLYQTWITGPQQMTFDRLQAPTTTRQFHRLVADRLALNIKGLAEDDQLRSEWAADVEHLPVDVDAVIASVRSMVRPVPDLKAGDVLLDFGT